jgi:hypothetical protein
MAYLTEREEEALRDVEPGDRFTQPHNIQVLNRLVKKGVLWAFQDGTYGLIENPAIGLPYPVTDPDEDRQMPGMP